MQLQQQVGLAAGGSRRGGSVCSPPLVLHHVLTQRRHFGTAAHTTSGTQRRHGTTNGDTDVQHRWHRKRRVTRVVRQLLWAMTAVVTVVTDGRERGTTGRCTTYAQASSCSDTRFQWSLSGPAALASKNCCAMVKMRRLTSTGGGANRSKPALTHHHRTAKKQTTTPPPPHTHTNTAKHTHHSHVTTWHEECEPNARNHAT